MKKNSKFLKQLLVATSIIALVFSVACSTPASSPTPSSPAASPKPTSPAASPKPTSPAASPKPTTSPAVSPKPTASPTPANATSTVDVDYTIHIEDPLPYSLVPTGNITMTVKVDNMKLVEKFGQIPELGEGHIDWYMDVDVPSTAQHPVVPKFGQHVATDAISHTWTNVPIGTRQFAVQLVKNDHSPYVPPIIDSIVLNVVPRATGPGVISAPGGTSSDTADPYFTYNPVTKEVAFAVEPRNFQISPNVGMVNQAGQGHYIHYKDVEPPTTAGQPATTAAGTFQVTTDNFYIWKNVEPGFHAFYVQLVNNDNTPLNPPVVYKAVINAATPGTPTPTASPTASPAASPTRSPSPTATASPTRSPSPTAATSPSPTAK